MCAAELLQLDLARCVQVVNGCVHEKGTPLARRPLVIMPYLPLDESYAVCGDPIKLIEIGNAGLDSPVIVQRANRCWNAHFLDAFLVGLIGRLTARLGASLIRESIKGSGSLFSLLAITGSLYVSAFPIRIKKRADDSVASITSPMETCLPSQTVCFVITIFMSIFRSMVYWLPASDETENDAAWRTAKSVSNWIVTSICPVFLRL